MPTFREKLKNPGARLTSHVCTIPSATVVQAIAAAGADAVIIDMEHGAVDFASAHAMIAATAGTDCAPTVRVPSIDATIVKRVLDLGAEGICFPLVDTAQDAERAVASLHYPPRGIRGFGPFIAHSRYGQDMNTYARTFSDRVTCCLLIETVAAVENIEAICAVPGIDLIIPAQFDLSVALGRGGDFEHPEFRAAVAKIEAAVNAANIPLGGVALTAEQAARHFESGYRVIAGFDMIWLKSRAVETQGWCAL